MGRRSQAILRKQKEAKQKKLLILLVPVLLILLVVQGPRVLKAVKGGEGAKPAPAETAAAPTDPATTTDPAVAGASPPATAPAVLVESDLPPAADEGQLVSFGRFIGKDPFRQQVEPEDGEQAPAQPGSEPTEAPDSGPGPVPDPPDDGGDEPTDEDEPEPDTAKLTVNGVAEEIPIDGTFPATDPVFRLVAVRGETVEIGLVTGSFSTGAGTIELDVGETLTLVSQPDGLRYVIKLLGVAVGKET